MAENDERRRSSGAAVVLLDEFVSLEFPYSVGVLLNFFKREAVQQTHRERVKSRAAVLVVLHGGTSKMGNTHLKIAMSRFSSKMLAKSR